MTRAAPAISGCLLALGGFAGVAAASSGISEQAVTPLVTSLGVTRSATSIGYCLRFDGRRLCADGGPSRPDASAGWRPGAVVRLTFGTRARSVTVQAGRTRDLNRGPQRPVVNLRALRRGRRGLIWVVRIPPRAARDNVLFIFASFGREGQASSAVGLRLR